ncbi:MBL fold metallo-hydrolase [Legionella cardiaca]|uniref:MBL fold metallo-hydrolase n=1 Tax=Legionella cardiaca TaxID=1071983 RepID=A0ABY8AUE6_9GAMM|nr:MBL fold metallo-hydrolase [Legionella cardiaca]WED42757.1 MBL fold metallo-hydrolase [Legionella cardiaca]
MPKILTSKAAIKLAQDNIHFLLHHSYTDAAYLELSTAHQISANRFLKTKTRELVKNYLQDLIDDLQEAQVTKQFPQLQLSFQKLLQLKPKFLKDLNLRLPENLFRSFSVTKHPLSAPENRFYHRQDLTLINHDSKTGLYTSPDDEMAHRHGKEAQRIFFSTQIERFKSFINYWFAKLGIYIFEKASYEEHDYLYTEIYADDLGVDPFNDENGSHFWVGHATNLIKIPTAHGPLHILTDPVEGHLNALLYPRMTQEANKIDGSQRPMLPKIDIVVISHNHRDHVDIATLQKLIEQQPLMVIPEGDYQLFADLGFNNIVELKWWEEIAIHHENNKILNMTAVPTKHWSGRGLCDAHHSAFNGYVFEAPTLNGDIYFAGDTALMADKTFEPVTEVFNIKTSIQPGGPDDVREDMKSTHQSSADAILMHFKILFANYKKLRAEEKDIHAFLLQAKTVKTIYNHTATFKLGNLRLRDTFYSRNRLIAAFKEDAAWRNLHLRSYELEVFNGIEQLIKQMIFDGEQTLSSQDIIDIITTSVVVPKIGERQELVNSTPTPTQQVNYRNLILNKRALVEYDALSNAFFSNVSASNFNLNDLVISLLKTYNKPWHARFSRSHSQLNLEDFMEKIQTCSDTEKLLGLIHEMEHALQPLNVHGHMSSLLNYSKWLIGFATQPNPQQALHEFFICQKIKKQVDVEIKHKGHFSWFTDSRKEKQAYFRELGNKLERQPCTISAYRENIRQWNNDLTSNEDGNPLLQHRFFAFDTPQSQQTVESIFSTLEYGK